MRDDREKKRVIQVLNYVDLATKNSRRQNETKNNLIKDENTYNKRRIMDDVKIKLKKQQTD